MIDSVATNPAAIIDVGGSSTLVDSLLDRGHTAVSVVDVSSSALADSRERLGARAAIVEWIVADVASVQLPRARYDVWHNRAVFHFLTEPADRKSYVDLAKRSLKVGGHAIVAAFSSEGPKRCSGLEVVRHSADSLGREFGPAFELRQETLEPHRTPSGNVQSFVYCLFERVDQRLPASP